MCGANTPCRGVWLFIEDKSLDRQYQSRRNHPRIGDHTDIYIGYFAESIVTRIPPSLRSPSKDIFLMWWKKICTRFDMTGARVACGYLFTTHLFACNKNARKKKLPLFFGRRNLKHYIIFPLVAMRNFDDALIKHWLYQFCFMIGP